MQRRWEWRRLQYRKLSTLIQKRDLPMVADEILRADFAKEAIQLRASPKRNMLAIVDKFPVLRIEKRGGPSAQESALFEEFDLKSRLRQFQRGGNPSNSAAQNDRAIDLRVLHA